MAGRRGCRIGIPSGAVSAASDETLLRWCQDAAIFELLSGFTSNDRGTKTAVSRPADRLSILKQVRREHLEEGLRSVYDESLIDALRESGELDELQARLSRIPSDECGPRVWQAIENLAMIRLALLAQDRDPVRVLNRALDLWDGVMRLSWPAGSEFPTQLTERVSALVQADATRRLGPWLDRLRKAGNELAARPGPIAHAGVIAEERVRVEARVAAER